MKVIILGAGEVGMDAARMLSQEQHSVTVIDIDGQRLKQIAERYDVLTLQGNGTSAGVLREAGAARTELLLAVTSIDEINIIASMLAQRLGVDHTIARVRSSELAGEDTVLTRQDFGIELMINPEASAAAEAVRLIRRSCATDVVPLANGKLQLLGIRLDARDPVIGKSLHELVVEHPDVSFRVMGIKRGNRTILPGGREILRRNDQVFILTFTPDVARVTEIMGRQDDDLEHVMILGGSAVGEKVARMLCKEGISSLKLVESDREVAQRLAEEIPGALVLNADPTDIDLLVTEGLGEMDGLLALTDNEEANLVTSLLGKHIGVKKTIALLSKSNYIPISQSIGLDAAVNRKLAVANEIMRFLRSKHVHNVTTIYGLDAEILEVEARPRARITKRPLHASNLPQGVLVGAVRRDGLLEIATGATQIAPGDNAIVFALPSRTGDVERYFWK